MAMRSRRKAVAAAAALVLAPATLAQYAERPDLPGSGSKAVDISGRSVKNQRIRAIHTTDPQLDGGTAYFIQKDPYLAYQLGRNLNFREFRERDGTMDLHLSNLLGPMPDGTTAKITANNQVSCSGCHNLPQGNPGGGVSFSKDSGKARNSPHYYGAGLVEMLALQIRADILGQLDTDGNGWVSAGEANGHGGNVLVLAETGGLHIDYGDPSLDGGATGSPRLNNIFRIWYVDANGAHVKGATSVDGVTTFGYSFNMIVWGWGQGKGRAALNPTNRAFLWDPYKAHGGLESYDPSSNSDPDGDGLTVPTLPGAIQFPATHLAPDKGNVLDGLGFSRDDPDADGFLNEISEGDLDLAELFMLNAPRPAFAGGKGLYKRGVGLLESMGCTECHVPNWQIHAESDVFDGDRRFFDLDVRYNAKKDRLEGELVPLYTLQNGLHEPNRDAFLVTGIFTDLKHHDMGEESAELDFGGNVNALWRTPPLWGVGSGFPWHHDGQSLSIEDSILRHGGEGAAARSNFVNATKKERRVLLAFLEALVLYDIETLPSDIDGDGVIADHFMVAGQDTGMERFNPEWLFLTPAIIQETFVNTDGVLVPSWAVTNVPDAYGELLPFRIDTDSDGWPDVWDNAPLITGYKDGVN